MQHLLPVYLGLAAIVLCTACSGGKAPRRKAMQASVKLSHTKHVNMRAMEYYLEVKLPASAPTLHRAHMRCTFWLNDGNTHAATEILVVDPLLPGATACTAFRCPYTPQQVRKIAFELWDEKHSAQGWVDYATPHQPALG